MKDIVDLRVKWEFLEYKIRQFTEYYSKQNAVGRRDRKTISEENVRDLEQGIKSDSDWKREKRNKSKLHIQKLILDSNDTSEETDDLVVLRELKSFYSSLYKKRFFKTEDECMEYLKNINTPKVQDSDIECCEEKLTLKECCEALNSMKNDKSLIMINRYNVYFRYFLVLKNFPP